MHGTHRELLAAAVGATLLVALCNAPGAAAQSGKSCIGLGRPSTVCGTSLTWTAAAKQPAPSPLCCGDEFRPLPSFKPYCYAASSCAEAALGCRKTAGCDTNFKKLLCPEQEGGHGPGPDGLSCYASRDLFCRHYHYRRKADREPFEPLVAQSIEVKKIVKASGGYTMSDGAPAPWCAAPNTTGRHARRAATGHVGVTHAGTVAL